MEIHQLQYFANVAKCENIRKASQELGVSAPSVSKAIAQLESELGFLLFYRVGRKVRLTSAGAAFAIKTNEALDKIKNLYQIAKHEQQSTLVNIAGRELLLNNYCLQIIDRINSELKHPRIRILDTSGIEAIQLAKMGSVDFCLTVQRPPVTFTSEVLGHFHCEIIVGSGHKLYKYKSISVDEVLEYDFASPNLAMLDGHSARYSTDGWPDQKFPRKIKYSTLSQPLIMNLVSNSSCLAYVPSFIPKPRGIKSLPLQSAPFTTSFSVYLASAKANSIGWMNRIFR